MITITADHEGGCLDRAVKCAEDFYALCLRQDTWYYFNFKITGCKDKEIIFQFMCRDNLAPDHNEGRNRWLYGGYIEKPLVSYDNGKTWSEVDSIRKLGNMRGQFIFSNTFKEDEAIVSFSPTYLYTDLQEYLNKIKDHPLVKISDIGTSRSGRAVPRVSITRNPDSKKAFILIGREDADEVTGSTSIEAAIDWLLSDDPKAAAFLEKYHFECIPMVGVDGVVYGSTHSAGYGYGGNTYHLDPAPREVQNVINFVRSVVHDEGREIVFAGKLHGGMRYTTRHIIDYLTASPTLDHYLKENKLDYWQPHWTGNALTIRPLGYFERFVLDEFLVTEVFGCHVNGKSKEACYYCGRDLMRVLANYLELYNK